MAFGDLAFLVIVFLAVDSAACETGDGALRAAAFVLGMAGALENVVLRVSSSGYSGYSGTWTSALRKN